MKFYNTFATHRLIDWYTDSSVSFPLRHLQRILEEIGIVTLLFMRFFLFCSPGMASLCVFQIFLLVQLLQVPLHEQSEEEAHGTPRQVDGMSFVVFDHITSYQPMSLQSPRHTYTAGYLYEGKCY